MTKGGGGQKSKKKIDDVYYELPYLRAWYSHYSLNISRSLGYAWFVHRAAKGVIHKPSGQIFGYFWSSSFIDTFT